MYERKCPFTLHVIAPELIEKVGHTIEQAEELKVKILAQGGTDDRPEVVKIELFGYSDYFFCYEHTCDVFDFSEMRAQ